MNSRPEGEGGGEPHAPWKLPLCLFLVIGFFFNFGTACEMALTPLSTGESRTGGPLESVGILAPGTRYEEIAMGSLE